MLALAAAAQAVAAAPATKRPGMLVVALNLPRPAFQVGAVRGGDVVLARGLEIELARALARRLGVRARFVQVSESRRLLAPGRKPWDVALAQLVPTPEMERSVDFSTPYLRADQAVLLSRGVEQPRGLVGLRRLRLCAERGSRGAGVIAARVRPSRRPRLARDLETLLRWVQTGVCEAAVGDVGRLGPAIVDRRKRFGRVAGRIETGAYAIALERGSQLRPSVDQALRGLAASGVLRRLARAWLGIDLARLRVLG